MHVPITWAMYWSYILWFIYDTIYIVYLWLIYLQFICGSCVYQLHVSFMYHINYDSYMIQFICCMYESYIYNLFVYHACTITCFIYASYKLWFIYDTIYFMYVWIIHVQFISGSCMCKLHVSYMHHINYDSYMNH